MPQFIGTHLLRCLLPTVLLFLAAASAQALPRHSPVPGGIAVLPVEGENPHVMFADRQQAVVREDERQYVLVGIPLETEPGQYELRIEDGSAARTQYFTVNAKHYTEQRLTIPDSRMVTPPPEMAQRIAEETARLTELKKYYTANAMASTPLLAPIAGRQSSSFGMRRILNGEPRSPHSGMDIAVGSGQPVVAPTDGTVLAVEDFYFTGKVVVVDHGQGLITLYAHLSATNVSPGQKLKRGERLGLSGATGRATGPHLHWGVFLGGTAVNPALFLPATKNGAAAGGK